MDCRFGGMEERTYIYDKLVLPLGLARSKTHVCDDELEVRSHNTQAQRREGKRPVGVSMSLHCRKNEGDDICYCAKAHDELIRHLVLNERCHKIRE